MRFAHLLTLMTFALAVPAAGAQQLPSFTITVKDGRFSPDRLEVPADTRVKLVLKNEGPGPLEFENPEMHVEKVISAGVTSFVVLPRLQPGQYDFIDEFNPFTGELKVIAK